jgi:3-oxoacyl-[acyl-carrier-protein] synthase I
MNASLAITGAGARCSVGANFAQTCSSVRAGIMGFCEHASYQPLSRALPAADDEDVALLVAAVPGLDPELAGSARLVALASAALTNLIADAALDKADLAHAALLASLPANDDAVAKWELASGFASALAVHSGVPFRDTRLVQSGHTGALELLRDAAALLAEERVNRCVLLGVDSYLSRDRLELLDAAGRVKSARNVDGFIPGEAAFAVLLERPEYAAQRAAVVDAIIAAASFDAEPETIAGEKQSTGGGLTRALRPLLEHPGELGWAVCDLNGESYRHIEWGVVQVRLGPGLAGARVTHPADRFGDIGAASGAALAAMVAGAFRYDWAPRGDALVWAASDGGARAGARVHRPAPAS